MNKERLDELVDIICDAMDVTEEDFYSPSKVRRLVDARQMFYYIAKREGTRTRYILDYMAEKGRPTFHHLVQMGYHRFRKNVEENVNVRSLVNNISNAHAS